MSTKVTIGYSEGKNTTAQVDFLSNKLKAVGTESEFIKVSKVDFELLKKKTIDFFMSSSDLISVPEGIAPLAFLNWEDPSEMIVINKNSVDEKSKFSLKTGSKVITNHFLNTSQLLAYRGDLEVSEIEDDWNLLSKKLKSGECDAIMLAFEHFLGNDFSSGFYSEKLNPREFIPFSGQGTVGLYGRKNDETVRSILNKIISVSELEFSSLLKDSSVILPEEKCVLIENIEDETGESIYSVRIVLKGKTTSAPKYFYFESKKTEGFIEKISRKIKDQKAGSVFVTRNFQKNDFLKNCLEGNGYKVLAKSLVEIKKVRINRSTSADWIFFPNKNAVRFFFEQQPEIGKAKIGVSGKTVAAELRKHNRKADFIGNSDDSKMTGKKFAALAGSGTILFPQSKGSGRTVQQQIVNQKNVIDLIVCETVKEADFVFPAKEVDVVVFTNPANVEAFFERNRILANHKTIALGEATAAALRNYQVRADKIPASFDNLGIVQAVFGI